MYQVSFSSLLYFHRYAPDKLFIAKIKKRSNSIIIGDRVMLFASRNSSHDRRSVYQVSLNYPQYFKRYAPDISVTDGRTDGRTKRRLYSGARGAIKLHSKKI